MHDVSLISTIAVGFAIAFPLGYVAHRLRLSPLVGYLVAGILIGRFTPEAIADKALAGQLAEIGVMLLMFGVGLHFSLADLIAVRRIAIPGAIAQITFATAIGIVMAKFWGWTFGAGLILGLSLSVASTVVLLKALEERNAVTTPNGRIAIGWLIVEDLVMVLALVIIPTLAEVFGGAASHPKNPDDFSLLANITLTLLKVTAFVSTILFFGPRLLPKLLRQVARTGSRELFTLCVLAVALGIAFASAKLFGVSYALGAFFAGVVLTESDLSHKAAANSLPLQDAFAVLFFVSVGMLFDPSILIKSPMAVAAVLLLILVGKSIAALGIVLALGYPIATAFTVAASLAQIGEFSFVLAGLGIAYGILPTESLSLILAGALLSISVNPFLFTAFEFLAAKTQKLKSLGPYLQNRGRLRFEQLQTELEAARLAVEQKSAAHKSFSPEQLAHRFPLFANLSHEQRETIALHFQPASAQPGERIIRAGDKADAVYFISSGEVEVVVNDFKTRITAGNYFGELAILTGGSRTADVIALDYCQLLTLSQRDFRELLRRYPAMRAHIADTAQFRIEENRQFRERSEGELPQAT
jgi:monovalent cation:H+ antiporter-2, CPA2 family